MGTAGTHLGPFKNPTGATSSWHGPQRTGDQSQHPVPDEDEEEKKEAPSAGAVWTPCRGFK